MTRSDHLFVYGTLRPGFDNRASVRLAQRATWAGRGAIRGLLYDLDDYPGFVFEEKNGYEVVGDLYRVNHAADWAVLDDYEDARPDAPAEGEFRRSLHPVLVDGQGLIPAWIYVYQRAIEGLVPLPCGDYLACRQTLPPERRGSLNRPLSA